MSSVINRTLQRFSFIRQQQFARMKHAVAYMDLETTGFSRERDRVIEIAALCVSASAKEENGFQMLVNPGRHIPPQIEKLTGITTDMVVREDVPDFYDVGMQFIDFINSNVTPSPYIYIIMHNGRRFDGPFLHAEFERAGLTIPENWRFIDSLQYFREVVPTIEKGLSLRNLTKHYNIIENLSVEGEDADKHRALWDCRLLNGVTSCVFQDILDDYKEDQFGELLLKNMAPFSFAVIDEGKTISDNKIRTEKKKRRTKTPTKRMKKIDNEEGKEKKKEKVTVSPLPDLQLTSKSFVVDDTGLSPMMKHYIHTKKQHSEDNKIVMYRVGDFFEAFFEDAYKLATCLDIICTSISAGKAIGRVPMAGIPYHALNSHLKKLMKNSYSIVICDQILEETDEKKATSKLMERRVTRILTPGTVVEDDLLFSDGHNYLASLYYSENNNKWSLCHADVTCGEFKVTEMNSKYHIIEELNRLDPSEVLISKEQSNIVQELFKNYPFATAPYQSRLVPCNDNYFQPYQMSIPSEEGISDAARSAGAALLNYLRITHPDIASSSLSSSYNEHKTPLKPLTWYTADQFMLLDALARRNLEITSSLSNNNKNKKSLYTSMDRTVTPMGHRLLSMWITQPLTDIDKINERLDSVDELLNMHDIRIKLQSLLTNFRDMDRIASRCMTYKVTPKDLYHLGISLQTLSKLSKYMNNIKSTLLQKSFHNNDRFLKLIQLGDKLVTWISPDCKNGFNNKQTIPGEEDIIISDGVNDELDSLRALAETNREWLDDFIDKERKRTGYPRLKVGYAKFGYYVGMTKTVAEQAKKDGLPDGYIRKQSLTNEERYTCPELSEYERIIYEAREKTIKLQEKLFHSLIEDVNNEIILLRDASYCIAEIDILCGFAQLQIEEDYCRPEILNDSELTIRIINGRHPVVEQSFDPLRGDYVANSTYLGTNAPKDGTNGYDIILLTGPNASGKSCFLRQVGLIQIMAQIGCYVPAESCSLSICDRLFTRVGAIDDVSAGKSTFMVEMSEVATILKHATNRSLVLLDEVGRGTSTVDGLSIAQAVTEYLADHIKARTIFATHYHELNLLERKHSNIANFRLTVNEVDGNLVFQHHVERGGTNRSFGIEVAKFAGLPSSVIERAQQVQTTLLENEENNL